MAFAMSSTRAQSSARVSDSSASEWIFSKSADASSVRNSASPLTDISAARRSIRSEATNSLATKRDTTNPSATLHSAIR
ncbi:MAG: hypothetical protein C0420_04730 [Methylobacterium sp.]|nr:hypothetical protein [Methylobacterium sp.]